MSVSRDEPRLQAPKYSGLSTFARTTPDGRLQMSRAASSTLSQILLHISPPPLNISETRDVYRAMKQFGEVEVFKVVRHSNTTNLPTPMAHVIFASPPRNLPRSFTITTTAPAPLPPTALPPNPSGSSDPPTSSPSPFLPRNLTLTPLPSNFPHQTHITKILRSMATEGIRGLRATVDVPEEGETEEDEEKLATKERLNPRQRREEPGQYGRLLRLYAGNFRGFDFVEERGREEVRREGGNGPQERGNVGVEGVRLPGGRRGPRIPKGLDTTRGKS